MGRLERDELAEELVVLGVADLRRVLDVVEPVRPLDDLDELGVAGGGGVGGAAPPPPRRGRDRRAGGRRSRSSGPRIRSLADASRPAASPEPAAHWIARRCSSSCTPAGNDSGGAGEPAGAGDARPDRRRSGRGRTSSPTSARASGDSSTCSIGCAGASGRTRPPQTGELNARLTSRPGRLARGGPARGAGGLEPLHRGGRRHDRRGAVRSAPVRLDAGRPDSSTWVTGNATEHVDEHMEQSRGPPGRRSASTASPASRRRGRG